MNRECRVQRPSSGRTGRLRGGRENRNQGRGTNPISCDGCGHRKTGNVQGFGLLCAGEPAVQHAAQPEAGGSRVWEQPAAVGALCSLWRHHSKSGCSSSGWVAPLTCGISSKGGNRAPCKVGCIGMQPQQQAAPINSAATRRLTWEVQTHAAGERGPPPGWHPALQAHVATRRRHNNLHTRRCSRDAPARGPPPGWRPAAAPRSSSPA